MTVFRLGPVLCCSWLFYLFLLMMISRVDFFIYRMYWCVYYFWLLTVVLCPVLVFVVVCEWFCSHPVMYLLSLSAFWA